MKSPRPLLAAKPQWQPRGETWVRQTILPGYELHVHAEFLPLREEQLAFLALVLRKLTDNQEVQAR
ncbi:MAG: hypothetical protein ACK42L_03000 [Thermoanaerobaculum sp.]